MNRSEPWWFSPVIRIFGNGGAFAVALTVTAMLVGKGLPFPTIPDVSPKFRYFAEHKDRFDTIFVGSSRFRHQIIPQKFDAETRDHGTETSSFNLGASGMWPPETFFFLRQILRLHPARLKWVIFEIIDGKTRVDEGYGSDQRAVYWHDWRHTLMAWKMVWESPRTPEEKRHLFPLHTGIFFRQFLHLGRGTEWAQEKMNFVKKHRVPSWIEARGFEPEPEPSLLAGPVLAEYLSVIEQLKKPRLPRGIRPGLIDALREIQAEVRAAGAEALFVLPPTINPNENFGGLPEGLPFILFNNLHDDALLYEPELHYDGGHLNARGAEAFTRRLGERFSEWRRQGR